MCTARLAGGTHFGSDFLIMPSYFIYSLVPYCDRTPKNLVKYCESAQLG